MLKPTDRVILQRVVAECGTRLSRANPSPIVRQLSRRVESLRAALEDWSHRAPSGEQEKAVTELVLEVAEQVLGRIDSNVDSVRRLLGVARADRKTDPPEAGESGLKVCPACRTLQPSKHSQCRRCGHDLSDVGPTSVVDGRYALVREIGRGGMGSVHLAQDLGLERSVAIKLLLHDGDDRAVARFQREAKALALVRNAHVIQVYAFGMYEGSPFLAMEHVEGSSLEEAMESFASAKELLPVARVITLVAQVANGLAAVHRAGIVHRDLKPSNVLVEERSGRPVIIDFGLALQGAEQALDDESAGTPLYMAPEQVRRSLGDEEELTPRVDVYALACMAYELLCGRTPFKADSITALLRKQMDEAPPPPSSVRPGLSDFDQPLLRALAKDPALRHATCEELAAELEAAFQTFSSPGPTLRPPPPQVTFAPEPPTDGEKERLRILVVDDDEMLRQLCARCALAAFGASRADVIPVSSGSDALAAAEAKMPDLVLLDYAMPGLDGVETLARLRALPRGTKARVIVVSAAADMLPRWKFAVLGVNDFVTKPVRIVALMDLMKEIAIDAGWRVSPAG